MERLFKQVGVGAGADENHFGIGDAVYQEPVRSDMAFPASLPFAAQTMRMGGWRQRGIFLKQ